MLKPPSLKKNESHENFSQNSLSKSAISEDLNEYDKQNNNYLFKQDELVNDRNETDEADDEYKQLNGHVLMDQDSSDEEDDEQRASIDRSFKSDQQLRVAKSTPVKERRLSDMKRDFELSDVVDFVHKGLETIIDDDVTKRFTTEELTVWNLLSRTNQQYEYVSFRVTVLWLLGLILRYVILFPFRLVLFMFACLYTFLSTFLIGLLEDGKFKRWLSWYASIILHRILSRVFSAIITYHDRENRAKTGSICVANHTSPIDVIILSTDNCYSMIGQTHGGFTGMMQRAFSRAARHIWFDRSETRDRGLVARRMREHVQDKNNMPILIFPEGTCINNTSVMMFKKGCFEVDTDIYPVAIKYDLRFGDAFWNSSKHSMLQYLMLMMTSWAIVVDVYYLPPMRREEDEDATQFASRVKSEIVKKGSFVDLNWDGMLKRTAPKLDLMYEQQQKYVSQLKLD
jgi:glycerol-3-phosphate O-acyltransferase 3/4